MYGFISDFDLYTSTIVFDYCNFIVSVKIRKCEYSKFFCLLKIIKF